MATQFCQSMWAGNAATLKLAWLGKILSVKQSRRHVIIYLKAAWLCENAAENKQRNVQSLANWISDRRTGFERCAHRSHTPERPRSKSQHSLTLFNSHALSHSLADNSLFSFFLSFARSLFPRRLVRLVQFLFKPQEWIRLKTNSEVSHSCS